MFPVIFVSYDQSFGLLTSDLQPGNLRLKAFTLTAFSLQHLAFNLQPSAFSLMHSTFNVQTSPFSLLEISE